MRSDAINTREPDICYEHDMTVTHDGICPEWRGSLRAEKINEPPLKEKPKC
jgi:hypothetical protein